MTDSDVTLKSEKGQFAFESAYESLGELPVNTVAGVNWATEMFTKGAITTAITKLGGGSMLNYEGAANYLGVEATANVYRRMGAHFGAHANSGAAVFRFALLTDEPSTSGTRIGSGFRVKLSA